MGLRRGAPGTGRGGPPPLDAASGLVRRASFYLADMALAARSSPRLLALQLRAGLYSVARSPYAKAPFEAHLRVRRARGTRAALVYGEVPWVTLAALFRWADLRCGETFVDAGCGSGRTLALAAASFGARAVGIEIDPFRAALARRLLSARRWPEVEVLEGDAAELLPNDADLVLLPWTCFAPALRARIEERLELVARRRRVRLLCVTHEVRSPAFAVKGTGLFSFTWGKASVHLATSGR